MTGIAEFNFPAFDAVASRLRQEGHRVISPAEMDRADGFNEKGCTGHETLTVEQRRRFARNDIDALLKVDGIILLPGWRNSTGATNESKVASWLGLDAFEVTDTGTLVSIALDELWSSVKKPLPDINPLDLDVVLSDARRNHRAELLAGADKAVNGDRNAQYGDPRQDFQRTATMWTAYLGVPEGTIEPHDVAALMGLLKLSRIRWSPTKQDSWMDLAGYAACGFDCVAP
jgi:hypothetical protein